MENIVFLWWLLSALHILPDLPLWQRVVDTIRHLMRNVLSLFVVICLFVLLIQYQALREETEGKAVIL